MTIIRNLLSSTVAIEEAIDGYICLTDCGYVLTHEEAAKVIADLQAFYADHSPQSIKDHNMAMRLPDLQKTGFVYLIRFTSGIYKIGATINPEKRMKELRHKFGDLELLHTIPSDDYMAAESMLHARYREDWVGHERFVLTDEDVAEIKAIKRI